jgi:5-methylcytosine-specific restriction enzyme A
MRTSNLLDVGQVYTRAKLKEHFDIKDATINTGVFRPAGHDSVWLFVTEHKSADRTQYADYFDGQKLEWDGQLSGRTDPLIVNHRREGLELLLFYRREKYEFAGAGFRYHGPFEVVSYSGNRPTHFILAQTPTIHSIVNRDLHSEGVERAYFEGEQASRFSDFYERNAALRAAAIRLHGTQCRVCGFDFECMYGPRGRGYIEVHHLTPVSSLSETRQVDPAAEMTVLCANCHRMIHRDRDDILTPEALRERLAPLA